MALCLEVSSHLTQKAPVKRLDSCIIKILSEIDVSFFEDATISLMLYYLKKHLLYYRFDS